MTVSCPECRSVFRVDPAKVPATGVRARCSVCGGVIAIAGGTLPVSVTPVGASTAVPAFPGGVSRATPGVAMAAPAARRATPLSPQASVAPRAPTPVHPTGAVMGAQPTPVRPSVVVEPAPSGPIAAPARPSTPLATAAVAAAPVAVATATPYPVPAMATPAAGTPAAGKKPINPFLRADPSQRARRLARALVSDLVAYHPQKREEGLRDGTLRQLFREEIKKSYEEYVEQVGRDVAESAPHFQEALNEILAGGRRLF
jgi:predicted Zn finger-like uncharacterized protein